MVEILGRAIRNKKADDSPEVLEMYYSQARYSLTIVALSKIPSLSVKLLYGAIFLFGKQ